MTTEHESESRLSIPPPEDETTVSFDPLTQLLLNTKTTDRKLFRRALVLAVLAHVALLLVTFPNRASPKELSAGKAQKVFVVQNVRFKPPVQHQKQEVPKRRVRKIPIPDPTPDDPEPLLIEELPLPDLDLPEVDDAFFGIPDAPPSVASGGRGDGAIHIGEGVLAPQKIHAPQPRYTEEARQGRIQGTVILQAVIDASGDVAEIEVLKGLPLGLDVSAIDTVRQWKFKPATLNGAPVAVYLSLLINFSLQ